MEQKGSDFVRAKLPWLIGIGGLIVFLITLNHWLSLAGLSFVNLLTDPDAIPPITSPLYFLLTYPIRWLPGTLQTTSLNLLSAVLASVTLVLLARSVVLLPHDRTRDQRHREPGEEWTMASAWAWFPPVIAAVFCGLQLSFWEHATAGTNEMLNLALFAYIVRCLLEYRFDGEESWLSRMALVYGIAVTNSYALIGYFPLFVVALIWIMGRDFFDFGFILKMVLLGVAGLAFYLILPIALAGNGMADVGFWQALKTQLVAQKSMLLRTPRYLTLFATLTSVLPLAFIGIRWPSTFGDISAAGAMATKILLRVVHSLLLVFCVWTVFDAPFSARALIDQILAKSTGVSANFPFLSFHYLCCLAIGYLVGYHLLVYGEPEKQPKGRRSRSRRSQTMAAAWVIVLCGIGAVATLGVRNYPSMTANNGSLLQEYAFNLTENLPPDGAILLADSFPIQAITQTYLNQRGVADKYVSVNTRYLALPSYQQKLHEHYPEVWPEPPTVEEGRILSRRFQMFQIADLAIKQQVTYLHPSFGFFFEPLYQEPNRLTYPMLLYPVDSVTAPPLSPEVIEKNTLFWQERWSSLEQIARWVAQGENEPRVVGRWYSHALNSWGVRLQQMENLQQAHEAFALAAKLNPQNLIAEINLTYNDSIRAGNPTRVILGERAEDVFGRQFRSWTALLSANGMFDEPGYCFRLAQLLTEQSLLRQAAIQYLRAWELEPDNIEAALALADAFLIGGQFERTIETAERNRPLAIETEDQVALARLESLAYFRMGNQDAAETVLKQVFQKNPESLAVLQMLIDFYFITDRPEEARTVVARQLSASPDDPKLLLNQAIVALRTTEYDEAGTAINKLLQLNPDDSNALLMQSALLIQRREFTNAIPVINRVLELRPNNQAARLNRAIAELQSNQLEAAKQDYEALILEAPTLHSAYYGLAEIAQRQNNTAKAIEYYETYLELAPPNIKEREQVEQTLKELKPAQN